MPASVHVGSSAAVAFIAAAALFAAASGAAEPPLPPASPAEGATDAAAGGQILCSENPGPVALGSAQWNGWGRGVDNTRYQPEPAIRAADVSRLALKWAFGYPGASSVSGQPTIVDGRVFVGGAGRLYALDAKSGCTYWRYDTDAHAFSAIVIAELGVPRQIAKPKPRKSKRGRGRIDAHLDVLKPPSAAFFGDDKGTVYALDAERGTLLWKTQLESQPTARILGAPVVYQDHLYVTVGSSEPGAARDAAFSCCTFRGSVASLDIATGRVAWKTYLVAEEPRPIASAAGVQQFGPAGIAVAGAPTLDTARGLVYVATGDSFNPPLQPSADAVVALDLHDGQVRWSKQLRQAASESGPAEGLARDGSARDFTASPILRTLTSGRQILLAGQRSGIVYGLDPERSGEVLWQINGAENKVSEGIETGMAADHHDVYAALSGFGAEPPNQTGSLVAIDMKTGAKRWQRPAPPVACSWTSASVCAHGEAQAVTVIPGAAFSGSMDGHLRAYSTIDGKILWDYDTAKDFVTVNRVKAGGGSLDQGGATIVNGVVYLNSGSERGSPGNVLLAFSVGGK
jgi:polyvinyl alcohol dehydrogenase (cytochrome)